MVKSGADINKGRLLGAHCSSSGGIAKAVERGGALKCSAIQLFTKNSNQWEAPSLSLAEIDEFKEAMAANRIKAAFSHAGYLINLSTLDPAIHESSMESMKIELVRAEALELPYVIIHPGSHKEAGEFAAILQLVENLRRLMAGLKGSRVQIVLETTAGQGTSIGYNFEHFAEIFNRLDWPADIGLCIDTAHIFQAGHDIRTKDGYKRVMTDIDEAVGLDYVRVIHLNDSKTDLGSRVDRHENIGKGRIGCDAFKLFMNDRRLANIPMVIETPKGTELEEDAKNLVLLRGLIK